MVLVPPGNSSSSSGDAKPLSDSSQQPSDPWNRRSSSGLFTECVPMPNFPTLFPYQDYFAKNKTTSSTEDQAKKELQKWSQSATWLYGSFVAPSSYKRSTNVGDVGKKEGHLETSGSTELWY
ncbi:expressed unknown protein [Seminavis robusta]|uniref:Uncharacterized protein n=1 Tax=Seminavis robusta TaxID=568900 RepID=A0A9N8E0L9_9STRA|nr:expressed unknown protein [Seminavis robusta]|eukprot:Sro431_g141400.1 n/a (122) ;mRNA; f:16807-17172